MRMSTYGANVKMRGAGSWALVTGATDGIGREFAMQLAKQGFNVVAVSRTAEKLAALSKEIEQKYPGTKTCYYAMDFLKAGPAEYRGLAQLISHLDVAVLVNNVGMSHVMPVPFLEMDETEMQSICEVNIMATQRVTRVVAPGLVKRGKGLILNLGSFSGQWCTPLIATYAGSKGFLIAWSQALGEEMRRANVDVQLLNTYFVVSNMSKVRRASMMVPSPTTYVRHVLSRIGRSSGALGRPFTLTPVPSHAWIDWATAHLLPKWFLLRKAYDVSLDTRRRAIRKAERQAKAQ
ncbi:fatty acid elongation protein [Malassezia pachydermatis]